MDWNRLPLLNYQQMISPITQIHIKHMRHCPRPARAYLGARQQESLKCNSSERISTAREFAAAAHMIRLTGFGSQHGQLTNAATPRAAREIGFFLGKRFPPFTSPLPTLSMTADAW